MGLSRRAYAAHRKNRGLPGGTDTAVRKAIASGRISIGPDGLVDPEQADAEWERSTNSALQRSEESQAKALRSARETIEADERQAVPQEAVDTVNRSTAEAQQALNLGSQSVSYQKARAARETIVAQQQHIRLQRMRGNMVDAKPAKAHVFELARKERDHWLQLPARASAVLAAELDVDAHSLEVALDRVIRDHLLLLTEVKIELAPSLADV